jgi:sec-independent protein translocase protein TatA
MFDPSAPHIIILLIVVLLLFGSRRLPGAAKSLGQSMHIFKRSVSGLDSDESDQNQYSTGGTNQQVSDSWPAALPNRAPQAAPQDSTQAKLDELQRQVQDLQKQTTGGNAGQSNEPF